MRRSLGELSGLGTENEYPIAADSSFPPQTPNSAAAQLGAGQIAVAMSEDKGPRLRHRHNLEHCFRKCAGPATRCRLRWRRCAKRGGALMGRWCSDGRGGALMGQVAARRPLADVAAVVRYARQPQWLGVEWCDGAPPALYVTPSRDGLAAALLDAGQVRASPSSPGRNTAIVWVCRKQ